MARDFVWLRIDVPTIDEQHDALFETINDLMAALTAGEGGAEVAPTLTFLADYVQTHFDTESQLMAAASYPGREGHERDHGSFVAQLASLQRKHETGFDEISLAVALCEQLGDWLVEHIAKQDRAFGLFLAGEAAAPLS